MKIIFICASVAVENAIIGDTLDRAEALKRHPLVSKLSIVSLQGKGRFEKRGIPIFCVGSDEFSPFMKLVHFYKVVLSVIKAENPDLFYLYMCPTVAVPLYPIKLIYRIPVVQWFGHSIYTTITRLSLLKLSDLWFNSNKSMAPFNVGHLRLVGQGVKKEDFFYKENAEKVFDIITVGRITPVKKIEQVLEVIKVCKETFGHKYSLNICGDAFVEKDRKYKEHLIKLVSDYNLEDQVVFSGMVDRKKIVDHIQKSRLFLFLVEGGVGKASLESIACGVPVVISSPEAQDFFGPELSEWFLCEKDILSVSKAVNRILQAPMIQYLSLCKKSEQLFLTRYTMEKFFDRIVTAIDLEFQISSRNKHKA